MAARNITHVDIMRGRPIEFEVTNAADAEQLYINELKDGIISVNEEIKEESYEVEDGTEMIYNYARKCTIELTYSEVDTTDIGAVSGLVLGNFIVKTNTGGANSTGKILTMSDCDVIKAYIEDLKTKIVAVKTTSSEATLPYTIADNAA